MTHRPTRMAIAVARRPVDRRIVGPRMPQSITPPPLTPGDVLDERFVVEEPAGRGGLGTVYRGWDLEHEVAVAIKILIELKATDVLRFRREATLLAMLRLPGVVRYIAHGETPSGAPYLVMEWLEGETVARKMEHRGFDIAESVALVRTACGPLAALHASGLIHRDLKPDNLVMTGEEPDTVVVIDLGLARATARPEARVTATGVALGTPGYMAPEQIRGEPGIDARVDVFALGCVLYELVTGFPPFAGENALAVRTKILLTAPPRLTELRPDAPPELERAVSAMIAKDRGQRPATAAGVEALLAELGALAPGPRRTWNPARPPTVLPEPTQTDTGRFIAVTATEAWTGVVLVEAAPVEAASSDREATTAQLASSGDELRAAALQHGGQLDALEGGYLVVHMPAAPDLADLAARLGRTALGLRALLPDARMVVSSGRGPIDELIDQAAMLLVHASRAALFDRRGAPADGLVFVDDATAAALIAGDFELDRRPYGFRLVSEHR
jgi:hypothetical protein